MSQRHDTFHVKVYLDIVLKREKKSKVFLFCFLWRLATNLVNHKLYVKVLWQQYEYVFDLYNDLLWRLNDHSKRQWLDRKAIRKIERNYEKNFDENSTWEEKTFSLNIEKSLSANCWRLSFELKADSRKYLQETKKQFFVQNWNQSTYDWASGCLWSKGIRSERDSRKLKFTFFGVEGGVEVVVWSNVKFSVFTRILNRKTNSNLKFVCQSKRTYDSNSIETNDYFHRILRMYKHRPICTKMDH